MTEAIDLGSNLAPAKSVRAKRAKGVRLAKVPKDTGDRVWIQLEESEEIPPTGLFLGHNGNGFILQTGVPAQVPEYLLEILEHAVMSMPTVDPQTKQVLGYRDRLRYPYRKVDAPASAEA